MPSPHKERGPIINRHTIIAAVSAIIIVFSFKPLFDPYASIAALIIRAAFILAIIAANIVPVLSKKEILSNNNSWVALVFLAISTLSLCLWIFKSSNAHVNVARQNYESKQRWLDSLATFGRTYQRDSLPNRQSIMPRSDLDSVFSCGIPIILHPIIGTRRMIKTFTDDQSNIMLALRKSKTNHAFLEVLGETPYKLKKRLYEPSRNSPMSAEYNGILDTLSHPNSTILWIKSRNDLSENLIYNATNNIIYCPENERCAPIETMSFGRNINRKCNVQ